MANYTGPDCRLCRREGTKLFLKGDRCYSDKCSIQRRAKVPGQHGDGRKKVTEYGTQLREKQKVKRIYGLQEKQFRSYYEKAERSKGVTGEVMLQLLERRLDNVIYRLGFGASRSQARQLVTHGHFSINGKTASIPSMLINSGDVIAVKPNRADNKFFAPIKEAKKPGNLPKWLDFEPSKLSGKIIALPQREDIDLNITEQMIIELYSK